MNSEINMDNFNSLSPVEDIELGVYKNNSGYVWK